MIHLEMTEKMTKAQPIGLEGFANGSREFAEMWNVYVKNIIFACSVPMSTST
jgi:hypothetical protein